MRSRYYTRQIKDSPLLLVVTIVVTSCLLTGCDYYHCLQFENRSQSRLSVAAEGTGVTVSVDACSVVWKSWLGGPAPKTPVPITVTDYETNDEIYSENITPQVSRKGLFYLVDFTGGKSDTCQTSITDLFQIQVINKSEYPISIALDDISIGEVSARSTAIIGPIRGDPTKLLDVLISPVYDHAKIKRNLLVYADRDISYELGQIPTLHMVINDVR